MPSTDDSPQDYTAFDQYKELALRGFRYDDDTPLLPNLRALSAGDDALPGPVMPAPVKPLSSQESPKPSIKDPREERPPRPPELDEHGIPVSWRRDPVRDALLYQLRMDNSAEHWPIFQEWCEERSLKAFPASEETLLRFLLDPPISGPELCDTWEAVSIRHDAIYWNEDVDPYYLLSSRGVDVTQEGVVIIPEGITLYDEMYDELIRELGLYFEGVSG